AESCPARRIPSNASDPWSFIFPSFASLIGAPYSDPCMAMRSARGALVLVVTVVREGCPWGRTPPT
ncbi:MAG: hypothetical protein WA579_08965, partial [Rhodomicrobium sp.]